MSKTYYADYDSALAAARELSEAGGGPVLYCGDEFVAVNFHGKDTPLTTDEYNDAVDDDHVSIKFRGLVDMPYVVERDGGMKIYG